MHERATESTAVSAALTFPFGTTPAPGEALEVAAGVRWLRMRLPMASLNHINLWALEDQGGWTLIVGPKGLSPVQVAYWENLLERTVNHPAWKKFLDDDSGEWLFMKSQPTREFLRKEYDTDRALLVELGMVK